MNSAFGFGQTAEFFVQSPLHKFPKTTEGVQLKHTFEVTNTGDVPLIISNYEVACSCTKVALPGPIQPGETGKITVEFDTNGKYYLQDRKIILHTNTKRRLEYLRFKVYVIPTEE
jgi:hypothetical protein